MRIERTGSIRSKRTMVLDENSIKNILTHVALCVESAGFVGVPAEKVNAIEHFKEGIENILFLNDIKQSDYDEIKIELD